MNTAQVRSGTRHSSASTGEAERQVGIGDRGEDGGERGVVAAHQVVWGEVMVHRHSIWLA